MLWALCDMSHGVDVLNMFPTFLECMEAMADMDWTSPGLYDLHCYLSVLT